MNHALAVQVRSIKSVMGSMRNKVSLTNKIRMLAVVASIFFCAGQIAVVNTERAVHY